QQRQLSSGQAECLPRRLLVDALDFIENPTGLNLDHPVINVALTATHPNLDRLGAHGSVRKHPDPDLAATTDIARDRTPPCLDLPCSNRSASRRLQAILPERHRVAATGNAVITAFLLLAKFRALRL